MKKRFMSREQVMNDFDCSIEEYNEIYGEDIVGCFVYEEEEEEAIGLDLRNDGKFVYRELYGHCTIFDSVKEFEEWFFS